MDVTLEDSNPIHFSEKPIFMAATMTLYAAFTVVGTIVNLMVIIVIAATKKLHTTTNVFIAQLATGDLIILLFCMPFTVTSAYFFKNWPFGAFMCYLVKFAGSAGPTVTVLTLAVMSYERYVGIMKPFGAKQLWSTRNMTLVVVSIYIVALIRSSLRPMFGQVYRSSIDNQTGEIIIKCVEKPGTTFIFYFHVVGLLIFFFIILLVIGCVYWRIGVHLSSEESKKMMQNNPGVMAQRKQVVRMLTFIVVSFGSCWLLINIVCLMLTTHEVKVYSKEDWFMVFLFIARIFEYGNCVINPLIYIVMSSAFRQATKASLLRCCCRRSQLDQMKSSSSIVSSDFRSSNTTLKSSVSFNQ